MGDEHNGLVLSIEDFRNRLDKIVHCDTAGGRPVATVAWHVRAHYPVTGCPEAWDDFIPTPSSVPRSMNKKIGAHRLLVEAGPPAAGLGVPTLGQRRRRP